MERQDRIELFRALEVSEVEARAQHDVGYLVLISVEISMGYYTGTG